MTTDQTTPRLPSSRLAGLDGLRAVLVLLVVVHHVFSENPTVRQLDLGSLAVWAFFSVQIAVTCCFEYGPADYYILYGAMGEAVEAGVFLFFLFSFSSGESGDADSALFMFVPHENAVAPSPGPSWRELPGALPPIHRVLVPASPGDDQGGLRTEEWAIAARAEGSDAVRVLSHLPSLPSPPPPFLPCCASPSGWYSQCGLGDPRVSYRVGAGPTSKLADDSSPAALFPRPCLSPCRRLELRTRRAAVRGARAFCWCATQRAAPAPRPLRHSAPPTEEEGGILGVA